MTKPTIGFIGLGLMGAAMAGRLLDCGYPLVVVANRSRTAIDALIARGATERDSARELAADCDIVMFCMDTSESVESRVYGSDGVLESAREGLVVIDFGTSLPGSTKKIGGDLAAKGAQYLDAPLGRTPAHAVDGLLNIMCAGDEDAFKQVKPVLDDLGENVFHLGALGNGHAIKLINNFYGLTMACAMSEAFVVAERSGIPRQQLYDVMAAGPLRSGMMDFVKAFAIDQEIELAFSVANGGKDVGYYRKMAEDLGLTSRMSGAANATLSEAIEGGFGDHMVPEMVDYLSAHLEK